MIPLIGDGLRHCTVGFDDLSLTGRVLELLAACRLERVRLAHPQEPASWPLDRLFGDAGQGGTAAWERLDAHLRWKNPTASLCWLEPGAADLHVDGRLLPPGGTAHLTWDAARRRVTMAVPRGDLWAWVNVTHNLARQARDLLLERAPFPEGTAYYGHPLWPFTESATEPSPAPHPSPELPRDLHVMVVGLGSVGSEAVRLLRGRGLRWTLIDGGEVSVFNPHRQWLSLDDVGRPKAEVIAAQLAPEPCRVIARNLGAAQLTSFKALLDRDPPDLVLLTTGTQDQAILAATLWRRRIPHLVACAYPQARFFELTPVIPREATPCLHCFRGHLFRGAEGTPVVDDEVASFIYQHLEPADRDRAWVDLVAEPATPIDTGRIADLTAWLAVELLVPRPGRSAWLERLLAAGTTCLLGANAVEEVAPGEFAYGLSYPGQVIRLGLEDIAGTAETAECATCGRRLEVRYRLELPAAEEAAIDEGLLAG